MKGFPRDRMKKKCDCTKDQDGQCQKCRSNLVGSVMALGRAIGEFDEKFEALRQEFNEKVANISNIHPAALCEGCAKQYVDFGMSKMISLILADAKKSTAEAVFSNILEKLGKYLKKRPLTDKAWADLCRRRGWSGKG